MKKNFLMGTIIIAIFAIVLGLMSIKVEAITSSELEEYLFAPHTISGVTYIIRDTDKVKLQRFFKERALTDEEATQIQEQIDGAIAFMTEDGATEPNNVSSIEKKRELLGYAQRMAETLGYTVTYDSTETRLDFYKDGVLIESIFWGIVYKEDGTKEITTEPKLLKTGFTNYEYLVVPGIVLVAGTMIVVAKRKLKDE